MLTWASKGLPLSVLWEKKLNAKYYIFIQDSHPSFNVKQLDLIIEKVMFELSLKDSERGADSKNITNTIPYFDTIIPE